MGTFLGKGFAQAQVHIVNSTSAEGTSAFDNMHECLSKTLSQNCLHDEIAFSTSSHTIGFCIFKKIYNILFHLLWCKAFVQSFLPLVEKSFAHFISSTMVQSFCAKLFATSRKKLCTKPFFYGRRSCDLSTMKKSFAKGRMMPLQSIFHYGDFTLYY